MKGICSMGWMGLAGIAGAWTPGASVGPSPMPTYGFSVNTQDRLDVVAFWNHVYEASEGYQDRIGWTGVYNSTATGAEGTTSEIFVGDVERRVNLIRALCGVEADIRLNRGATVVIGGSDTYAPAASTTKAAAAQRSALMITREFEKGTGAAMSHSPSPSCTAWTTAAWNANAYGNLSQTFFGPRAIVEYAREDVMGVSTWNQQVGHRRWLLWQSALEFATGDVPPLDQNRPAANSLYVFHSPDQRRTVTSPRWVPYPAAGYFPVALNGKFWSLSYPGANFSVATVVMTTGDGTPVPTTIVSRVAAYGDSSLVWEVPTAVASRASGPDRTYHVIVAGVSGAGVPVSHSWTTTLIDPKRLLAEPTVSGPVEPTASGAVYTITPVNHADRMETGFFRRDAVSWAETAEDSQTAQVIERKSAAYPLRTDRFGSTGSGSKSFRLTFPSNYNAFANGVPDEIFELDREIVPGVGGLLAFSYRRGLMTANQRLSIEASTDGGTSWTVLGAEIVGSQGVIDNAWVPTTRALASGLEPVRVRFRYYWVGSGSIYWTAQDDASWTTGIGIDNITVSSGATWLNPLGEVATTEEATVAWEPAVLDEAPQVGDEWWLRTRAVFGNWKSDYGPAQVVAPVGPLAIRGTDAPPVNGATYTFLPGAGASGYRLAVSPILATTWTEGAETSPAPQVVTEINANSSTFYSTRNNYREAGSRSFRLVMPNTSDKLERFTIDRDIVPSSGASLRFWYRRGRMATVNYLHVEVVNAAGTATSIWNIGGLGGSSEDGSGTAVTLSLAAWENEPIRIRFALRNDTTTNNDSYNSTSSGVWIDGISVTGGGAPQTPVATDLPLSPQRFVLNAAITGTALSAGQRYQLRLGTKSGTIVTSWGRPKVVTVTGSPLAGYAAWMAYDYPDLVMGFEGDDDGDGLANGLEYAFGVDPRSPEIFEAGEARLEGTLLKLSRPLLSARSDVVYRAEVSGDLKTWTETGVSVQVAGGVVTASVTAGSGARFLRWKVEEP